MNKLATLGEGIKGQFQRSSLFSDQDRINRSTEVLGVACSYPAKADMNGPNNVVVAGLTVARDVERHRG
ncbi:MAG: hypothetical protein M0Z39_06880 [Actinomycetota bacterium]|nr:hypothetical protein [Actinomycetota bacterium]